MNLKDIPNLITLARIVLLFPLGFLLHQQSYVAALWLFLIAGLSDGLDGLLARTFHWTSHFGAIADPIADKLLMLVAYSLLGLQGILPIWLLILVVGRDILIVLGAWYLKTRDPHIKLMPTFFSKINTTFQILLVTVTMFALVFPSIPDMLSNALINLVAFTSLASGLQYLYIAKKLNQQLKFSTRGK